MPYTNGDGVAHARRTCRRLHNTGNRIRRVDDADGLTPCENCGDGLAEGESGTCEVELSSGDGICGRERPCPYHD